MRADTGIRSGGRHAGLARRRGRSGGRPGLRLLALTTAIGSLGLAAGGTAGPLIGAELISPLGAGLPPGVLVVGSAVAAVVISRGSARVGRAPALALGYAAGAVGAALVVAAVAAHSIAALLVGSGLLGAANAALFLTRYAAADVGGRSGRGYALGTVLAAAAVGAIVSPNLLGPSGRVAAALGVPGVAGLHLVAVVAFALAGSLLALAPSARAGGPAPAGPATGPAPGARRLDRRELTRALARPRVRTALLLLATTNLLMVGVMTVAPLHLRAGGHHLGFIGMVVSIHVAGMFALAPATGRLADRIGADRVAAGGIGLLVAAGAGGAVVAAHGTTAGVVLLGLLGLAWNAGVVGASALLGDSVPAALRPDVEGIGEAAMGAGAAVGSLLAGLVVTHGGISAAWACTALLAALVLPVAGRRRG